MFAFIRIVLGLLFIISGAEKALAPAANFSYVIRSYDVLPDGLVNSAAYGFPLVELLIGIFLVLGLWVPWTLRALMLVALSLIGMVGQAIMRELPLDNCGCFGNLIHLPLQGVIFLDMTILILAFFCLRHAKATRWLSLDAFYQKNP